MLDKKMVFLISGLYVFSGVGNAGINLMKFGANIVINFDGQLINEPIGCIYVDSVYLARLAPGEIQSGRVIMDTTRFSKRLAGKQRFRVGIFIEGFSGNEIIRKIQAGNFSYGGEGYNYTGETFIETALQDFVFRRFGELRKIRAKIKADWALWKADLTSVFMLPDEDRVKLCGFRAPQTKGEGTPLPPKGGSRQLPPYFDWTNKDGINWMTAVKDQGVGARTCWAFGTVGQVEALINIATNTPNPNFDLAEQTLVSDCCRYCGNCNGGMHFWALMYIRNHGIPVETIDPYTAMNGPCCKRPSKLWKITSYHCVTWQSADENAIKTALVNHPLSTSVYADTLWYSYTGGVYSYTDSLRIPDHCVVFVGWNDNDEGGTKTWKIKNSWGDDWGENGYMRLIRGQNNRCGWYTFSAEY